MLQQPEISNNLCSTFGKGHAGILVTLEWVKSSGIELTENTTNQISSLIIFQKSTLWFAIRTPR